MDMITLFSTLAGQASDTADGGTTGGTLASILSMILPLVLMVLIFYFLIIRPEKKRNKETQEMLNNIQVADEVITNGGIIGRVLSVQKDTVLIETGSDRTKIRVVKQAIAKNNTEHEDSAPVVEAKKSKGKEKTEIK